MKPRILLPRALESIPFSAAEGLDAGLGRHRMLGSDLSRPFQGVYINTSSPTFEQRCAGLAKRLDSEAFFCGVTAARIIGIPLPRLLEQEPALHVAVPRPRFRPTGRGIVGHTLTVRNDELRMWNGLLVTSPERTWCDLGAVLHIPQLIAAGDYLIHEELPITDVEALARSIRARSGRRGVKRLRVAHPYLDPRSESPQESKLRYVLVAAGLKGLAANFPIRTSGGYNYRGDLVFPSHKLIIEYQSDQHHNSPEKFRADMTRVSRLQADGWTIMLVNADDLQNPLELVARILRVLARQPGEIGVFDL
jgi:very-short-patch-repair endonuclease